MRPSVARKLNEKIRGLEGELEQLRTNKKVKDLEKKVQVSAAVAVCTPHLTWQLLCAVVASSRQRRLDAL
jgi:hypothetical protein